MTSQLAPDQVIATLGLRFDEALQLREVEALIHRLEKNIRKRHPQLFQVFVRPQSKASRSGGWCRIRRPRIASVRTGGAWSS